jgi:hypothetical protein
MEQTCKVFTCCIASNRYERKQRKMYTFMELRERDTLASGMRDGRNFLRFRRLRIFTFCDDDDNNNNNNTLLLLLLLLLLLTTIGFSPGGSD